MTNRRGRTRVRLREAVAACVVAGLFAAPVALDAQSPGVKYRIDAIATQTRWDDGLGLENGPFYGARAGIDFGRFIGLNVHYLWGNGFDTDLADVPLDDGAGNPLEDQAIDIRDFGGNVRLHLSDAAISPFLQAGAGVLQFDPAVSDDFDRIYGRAGAGLAFDVSEGIRGQLFASATRFEMDRLNLAANPDPGDVQDPEADDARTSWQFGASLGLDLGQSTASDAGDTWAFTSIPIEPFAGRLDFDNSIGRQDLFGVRAGVDLGGYFGLRGFYWRGVNDDLDATTRIRGYGGEAQFNLNAGRGLAPFLVLGGGRIDFMDGFDQTRFDTPPSDQNFVVAGGGLGIRLTDSFRLNVAARDHMISDVDFKDLAQPDQLQHNWMFTAGVAFAVGRNEPDRRPMPEPTRRPMEETEPARVAAETRTDTDSISDSAQSDAFSRNEAIATASSSDRILQIPVPERGELYVRYGDAGRLQVTDMPAQLRGARLTAEERRALDDGDNGFTDAELNALARAVAERLDSTDAESADVTRSTSTAELRRIVREELRRLDLTGAVQDAIRDEYRDRDEGTPDVRVRVDAPDAERDEPATGIGSSFEHPAGYMAVAFSDPESFVVGARVDAGSPRSLPNLVFVPEIALGFPTDGTSVLAAGNLEYRFGSLALSDGFSLRPMASLGAGLLSVPDETTEGVINVNYGFSSGFGEQTSSLRWFVAHQGIDFFDRNRLAFGLTWIR